MEYITAKVVLFGTMDQIITVTMKMELRKELAVMNMSPRSITKANGQMVSNKEKELCTPPKGKLSKMVFGKMESSNIKSNKKI